MYHSQLSQSASSGSVTADGNEHSCIADLEDASGIRQRLLLEYRSDSGSIDPLNGLTD